MIEQGAVGEAARGYSDWRYGYERFVLGDVSTSGGKPWGIRFVGKQRLRLSCPGGAGAHLFTPPRAPVPSRPGLAWLVQSGGLCVLSVRLRQRWIAHPTSHTRQVLRVDRWRVYALLLPCWGVTGRLMREGRALAGWGVRGGVGV